MKKGSIYIIIIFFVSLLIPQIHRICSNHSIILLHPFPFGFDSKGLPISISLQWYLKEIGEILGTTGLFLCVCVVLKPVENHLKEVKWIGHNGLLIFVTMWRRIFYIVTAGYVFDLIHYLTSYRHSESFFLITNAVFLFWTGWYIYKAYKK